MHTKKHNCTKHANPSGQKIHSVGARCQNTKKLLQSQIQQICQRLKEKHSETKLSDHATVSMLSGKMSPVKHKSINKPQVQYNKLGENFVMS